MEYIDKGINMVVEFGNYTSTFTYLLIANILTRRIHTEYVAKTEKFLLKRSEDEPKKLMITIEELRASSIVIINFFGSSSLFCDPKLFRFFNIFRVNAARNNICNQQIQNVEVKLPNSTMMLMPRSI